MAHTAIKVITTALASGIIGGGLVATGGYFYLQNQDKIVNTDGTTTTKSTIAPKVVTGTTNSTKVYNTLKNAVVSVLNEQEVSDNSSLGDILGGKSSSSSSKKDAETQTVGSGSGVIYKTEDGSAYIVTNNHVVDGASKLEVVLYDGTKVEAKLVGTDPMTDLAVLKITSDKVKATAEFGNSDQVKVGESVLAIGSPLGDEYASTVTQGIVSASKRIVSNMSEDGKTNYGDAVAIQTDTAINPGNSGGALVNMAGQVIGITSQKLTETSSGVAVEGMGFAIPSSTVVNIVNQLVKNGKVVRPALGIQLVNLSETNSDDREKYLKIPDSLTNGIVVVSLNGDDSPAKKAGIKKYDVITAVNGVKVTNLVDLRDQLYKHKIGDTVKITFNRGKTEKTVEVKLNKEFKN
jgi:serine protease Do